MPMFLQPLPEIAAEIVVAAAAVVLIAVAVLVAVVVVVVVVVKIVVIVNIVVLVVDMDTPLQLVPVELALEWPDSMLQPPFVLLLYRMVDNCRRIVVVADIGLELVVYIEMVLAILADPGIDHNHYALYSKRCDIKTIVRYKALKICVNYCSIDTWLEQLLEPTVLLLMPAADNTDCNMLDMLQMVALQIAGRQSSALQMQLLMSSLLSLLWSENY
jgi:hypothetical protein